MYKTSQPGRTNFRRYTRLRLRLSPLLEGPLQRARGLHQRVRRGAIARSRGSTPVEVYGFYSIRHSIENDYPGGCNVSSAHRHKAKSEELSSHDLLALADFALQQTSATCSQAFRNRPCWTCIDIPGIRCFFRKPARTSHCLTNRLHHFIFSRQLGGSSRRRPREKPLSWRITSRKRGWVPHQTLETLKIRNLLVLPLHI